MAIFQETWINNRKMFRRIGTCHVFDASRESVRDAVTNIEWATAVLNRDAVTYQNGRCSHEVAGEVLDRCEDALIDHLCITG